MIEQSYLHPNANSILDEVKTILSYSAKGKAYWENNKNPITVVKHPTPQAFVSPQGQIFLCVPALQQKGRTEQAIDISAAFAEIEMGEGRQVPEKTKLDDDETLTDSHMKNVMLILKAFEVAKELEDAGYDAVKELRFMGVGRMWQAWKSGADLQDCANIYWNMFDSPNEGEEE